MTTSREPPEPAERTMSQALPPLELRRAAPDDLLRIENLMQFYNYDLSQWTPVPFGDNGLYQLRPKAPYWAQPGVHPFLIHIDQQLAGFAVVDDETQEADTDHNMGYFFLARGYRGRGLATHAAGEVLQRFPGRWEVYHLLVNTPAAEFWPEVIRHHAEGEIQREPRLIHEDPCVLYRFNVAARGGLA